MVRIQLNPSILGAGPCHLLSWNGCQRDRMLASRLENLWGEWLLDSQTYVFAGSVLSSQILMILVVWHRAGCRNGRNMGPTSCGRMHKLSHCAYRVVSADDAGASVLARQMLVLAYLCMRLDNAR